MKIKLPKRKQKMMLRFI